MHPRLLFNATPCPTSSATQHLTDHTTLQSRSLRSLGRVLLALLLDLGLAGAALALGDRVHHYGDVVAAAPPGGLVFGEC